VHCHPLSKSSFFLSFFLFPPSRFSRNPSPRSLFYPPLLVRLFFSIFFLLLPAFCREKRKGGKKRGGDDPFGLSFPFYLPGSVAKRMIYMYLIQLRCTMKPSHPVTTIMAFSLDRRQTSYWGRRRFVFFRFDLVHHNVVLMIPVEPTQTIGWSSTIGTGTWICPQVKSGVSTRPMQPNDPFLFMRPCLY
jgi:hypothetical protein